MWVTMGKIADRSQDRLGASDLAIVEFRKQMVEAVKQFQQDATAIGTAERQVPAHVCAYQQVLPKTDDWRSFEGRYIWDDADASAQSDNAYVVKA